MASRCLRLALSTSRLFPGRQPFGSTASLASDRHCDLSVRRLASTGQTITRPTRIVPLSAPFGAPGRHSHYTQKTSPKPGHDPTEPPASPPSSSGSTTNISRSIETARQRTKAVTDRVRSSLPNLTPHENIYNLPNFLTVSRLFAAPAISYLILHDQYRYAVALFAYAGITDLVDGYLARKWKLQTVAGSVIDPMADKALMIIVTVTLAVKGAIPLYLATLILGRDASLALAAIYYRYASLPHPKTFLRYWDFSLPSAEVHPTTASKYNTFLQLLLIGSSVALPVVTTSSSSALAWLQTIDLHQAMTYFQYIVAATTAWSGLSYAFLKDAVTILGTDDRLKAKQGSRGRAIIGVVFGSVVAGAVYIAFTVDDDDNHDQQHPMPEQTKSIKA